MACCLISHTKFGSFFPFLSFSPLLFIWDCKLIWVCDDAAASMALVWKSKCNIDTIKTVCTLICHVVRAFLYSMLYVRCSWSADVLVQNYVWWLMRLADRCVCMCKWSMHQIVDVKANNVRLPLNLSFPQQMRASLIAEQNGWFF